MYVKWFKNNYYYYSVLPSLCGHPAMGYLGRGRTYGASRHNWPAWIAGTAPFICFQGREEKGIVHWLVKPPLSDQEYAVTSAAGGAILLYFRDSVMYFASWVQQNMD